MTVSLAKYSIVPYRSYSSYLREKFGEKIYKVAIDPGTTCPNRDGTVARGGCIFCDEGSHYKPESVRVLPVKDQILRGMEGYRKRRGAKKFIAYFQAYSGTYGDRDILKRSYEEALTTEGIVGLSIATRPDCLDEEILDILEEYSKKTFLWLELGLQSSHDKTLKKINRGHDYDCFLKAVEDIQKRKIPLCVHVILYLPGENREDMLKTAGELARLQVEGVKLHHLHILKNTALHKQYLQGKIPLPTMEEYVQGACDFIQCLPEQTVIHRVTGDAPADRLAAPLWTLKKGEVIAAIEKELIKRKASRKR